MNKQDQEIERIIETSLPAIENGQETLDSILAQHTDLAEALRPQLEAALWLRSRRAALEARPAYLSAARQRLVTQLRSVPQTAPASRRWIDTSPRSLVLEFVTLALLIVTMFAVGNNIRLASHLALPGEPLYPVKLALENLELALNSDPAREASLHTEFSRQRTSEVVELVLIGKYAPVPATAARLEAHIEAALADMDQLALSNPAQARQMEAALQDSLDNESFILQVLLETSPEEAAPGLRQVLEITTQPLDN